jgi:MerR family transcriptional regulator/heat shock protein HspR
MLISRTYAALGDGSPDDEPRYVISVAARMVGVHAQTLRYYERVGLVAPARSRGNIRMYSPLDVEHARWIRSLIDDLGINLAGVEVIMRLRARMDELERTVEALQARLRQTGKATESKSRGRGA